MRFEERHGTMSDALAVTQIQELQIDERREEVCKQRITQLCATAEVEVRHARARGNRQQRMIREFRTSGQVQVLQ